MNDKTGTPPFSRRQFVKRLALWGGAAPAPAGARRCFPRLDRRRSGR